VVGATEKEGTLETDMQTYQRPCPNAATFGEEVCHAGRAAHGLLLSDVLLQELHCKFNFNFQACLPSLIGQKTPLNHVLT
jgi:hypothetical protein